MDFATRSLVASHHWSNTWTPPLIHVKSYAWPRHMATIIPSSWDLSFGTKGHDYPITGFIYSSQVIKIKSYFSSKTYVQIQIHISGYTTVKSYKTDFVNHFANEINILYFAKIRIPKNSRFEENQNIFFLKSKLI